jgi:hypothetical protein
MSQVRLEIQRQSGIDVRSVTPDGGAGIAEGACPGCNVRPFHVVGGGMRNIDDRTVRANGRCQSCGDAVGYIYAERATVFGAEEDRAVLEFGRARVY